MSTKLTRVTPHDRRSARELVNSAIEAAAVVEKLNKELTRCEDRKKQAAQDVKDAEKALLAAEEHLDVIRGEVGDLLARKNVAGVRWSNPHNGQDYAAVLHCDGTAVVGPTVELGDLIDKAERDPRCVLDADDPAEWACYVGEVPSRPIAGRVPTVVNGQAVNGPDLTAFMGPRERRDRRVIKSAPSSALIHLAHPTAERDGEGSAESANPLESVVTTGVVS